MTVQGAVYVDGSVTVLSLPVPARYPGELLEPRLVRVLKRDDPRWRACWGENHDVVGRLEDHQVVVVHSGPHRRARLAGHDPAVAQAPVLRRNRTCALAGRRRAPGLPAGPIRSAGPVGRIDNERHPACPRQIDAPLIPELVTGEHAPVGARLTSRVRHPRLGVEEIAGGGGSGASAPTPRTPRPARGPATMRAASSAAFRGTAQKSSSFRVSSAVFPFASRSGSAAFRGTAQKSSSFPVSSAAFPFASRSGIVPRRSRRARATSASPSPASKTTSREANRFIAAS